MALATVGPAHCPPSTPERWLRLPWPWCSGRSAGEAGRPLLTPQMKLTTHINIPLSRQTSREGPGQWKARAFPHTWPLRPSLLLRRLHPLLGGQEPLQSLGCPIRMGAKDARSQRLRESGWHRRERGGRSGVPSEGAASPHGGTVTSHGPHSAEELQNNVTNGQLQVHLREENCQHTCGRLPGSPL